MFFVIDSLQFPFHYLEILILSEVQDRQRITDLTETSEQIGIEYKVGDRVYQSLHQLLLRIELVMFLLLYCTESFLNIGNR